MHMNIMCFHTSAKHNRNVVRGPSPWLCKCPYTIIKRDGLWLIGEGKSNQIVLALSILKTSTQGKQYLPPDVRD